VFHPACDEIKKIPSREGKYLNTIRELARGGGASVEKLAKKN